jgi:arsenite-transporting ATPase
MRIILFTGKGGVGKTSLSAATAIRAAQEGLKTLVLSTDPAHSLSDALGIPLTPEPKAIASNLYAQEFDVYYSMKKHWGNIRQLMLSVFKFQGVENVVAEELSALPGMEEASAFLWLEEYYQQKAYDLVIIDSAPTGETLSLLSLPQVTQSWVMKAFPGQRWAMQGFGAMVRNMTGIPLDKGMAELDRLFEKLDRIQSIMQDPEVCSIRLVMNPEKMVIKEAKRAYAYLQLYGYNVDGVMINRIFPESASTGPFKEYTQMQSTYIKDIESAFSELPIFKVLHQGKEVFGMEPLEKIGAEMYQDKKPQDVYYRDRPLIFEEANQGYVLSIKIPFVKSDEFSINKYGDELVIRLGNQRRSVFLPRFANYLQMEGHEFVAPWLKVRLKN